MNNKFENLWKIHELEQRALKIDKQKWLENELFTWNWWLLVAFLIFPWIIWSRLVDRNRILEIVSIGLLAIITTTLLDILGTEVEFWVYPTELIPGFPRAFAFDVSMIPVTFMLLYQYFHTWKSYSMALVLMAAIFAFVGEPFSIWADLVFYIKWTYIYSFGYYILCGIGIRAIVLALKSSQKF